ncbi:MAG: carbamoyltransferase C-terminal domain-containing protein [Nanoarchaeota archaeon]
MTQDIYILSMTLGHNATAAISKNAEIIATASEERFTRVKNVYGYPKEAIAYCLKEAHIPSSRLDLVVLASRITPPLLQTEDGFKEASPEHVIQKNWFSTLSKIRKKLKKVKIVDTALYNMAAPIFAKKTHLQRVALLSHVLNVDKSKIISSEHHLTHAYAGIFSSDILYASKGKKLLVITVDGEGDMLSATVGIFDKETDTYKRIASSGYAESLGHFYSAITAYLGMKMLEHEYKVMGLAPYSFSRQAEELYKEFRKYIWIDDELCIRTAVHSHEFEPLLEKICKRVRFDYVAAAAQRIVEVLLVELVKKSIVKTGIHSIILSGGVFMNVKANYEIIKLPEVEKIFIMPSSGDESLPIGSCYYGMQITNKELLKTIKPITNLYYGPSFTNKEIEAAIKKSEFAYRFRGKEINQEIARLLAKGQVVARYAGRMEFGARALGNRSILADASREEVLEEINRMIKMRDFWMPFAPSILAEHAYRYIKHPELLNKINPFFMTVTFESTPLAQKDLKAAIHPADKTLRPQFVTKEMNPEYYDLLREYAKKTGRYGLLNTSFNIHGEPIVCTPEDALYTLRNSGLKYAAIGQYMVFKR